MGEIDSRLEELIREVEGGRGAVPPSPRQPHSAGGSAAARSAARPSAGAALGPGRPPGGKGARWLPAFLVLLLCNLLSGGLGFWMGLQQARQMDTASPSTPTQQLQRQGWQNDGTGVLYRWCSLDCHAPRLFGGGLIREFQVRCLERPCGNLTMEFEVLNARGQAIDRLKLQETDLHWGEERRFYVESQNPEAKAFRLIAFVARARV
jgi:hypothetical protein